MKIKAFKCDTCGGLSEGAKYFYDGRGSMYNFDIARSEYSRNVSQCACSDECLLKAIIAWNADADEREGKAEEVLAKAEQVEEKTVRLEGILPC